MTKDENYDWATFQELSSNPSNMMASRLSDAHSCMPGNMKSQADAVGAYTQSYLAHDSIVTWIEIPRDQWPEHWHGKYKRPVCILVLALYGHPDSGGHWEAHCTKALMKLKWVPLGADWPGVYIHYEYNALMCLSLIHI